MNSPVKSIQRTATMAENEHGDRVVKITFPYNTTDLDNVRSLSGRRYHVEQKIWSAPVCIETVELLRSWGFILDSKLEIFLQKVNTHIDPTTIINIPGLKGQLFPFQNLGVAFIESRDGRALIADEQGLGKTIEALAWLQLHPERRPVIVVVPASLKLNWEREAQRWMSNPKVQVLSGTSLYKITGEIIVINYDILGDWFPALKAMNPQVLIMDECFPAGTKITTPKGLKNIEQLEEGDEVFNATGIGIIERINERATKNIIRLYLNDQSFIDVTPNHLFFTKEGWIPASELINKEILNFLNIFSILPYNIRLKLLKYGTIKEKMRMVWERIYFNVFTKISKKTILWNILFSEMEDESTRNQKSNKRKTSASKKIRLSKKNAQRESSSSTSILKTHERRQSDELSKSKRKSKNYLERIWTSSKSSAIGWWQWQTLTKSTKNLMGSFRTKLENRIPNTYKTIKRFWISHLLQSRYCFTKLQNMDRSGWLESSFKKYKTTRREKRIVPQNIRVERIEIPQSRSGNQPKQSIVYNLQVSKHPSYYAEGFLVHNCHYIKSNKARRTKATKQLVKGIPYRIGLSGTPIVNRPAEAKNAIQLIDSTIFPNGLDYLYRYCDAHQTPFGLDVSGASNTMELHEKLVNSIMLRRLKKDVLTDLPDIIHSFIPIELDNEKEYFDAEDDFITFIKNTRGVDAAQRASRAEELAKMEGLKQLTIKGKLKGVIEWIDDFLQTDQKLVVFVTHTNTINTLMDAFPNITVKLDGSVSNKQTPVDEFQNNPKIRLFIGMLDTQGKPAGVGITLTAAWATATIELQYGPTIHDQADARVHRITQKNAVTAYYLLAKGTIDERIARLQDKKRKVIDAAIDGKVTETESLLTELINEYINEVKI
jgi:intein/homing endonuclease